MKFYKSILCTTIAACSFASGALFAVEGRMETGDPSYAGEVLASAPLKLGKGSMDVVRTSEDGIDGIAISLTAPIGMRIDTGSNLSRLPISEHVALRFYELTGKRLTADAMEALKELEIAKTVAANDKFAMDDLAVSKIEGARSLNCTSYWNGYDVENYFGKNYYVYKDCYGHGPIVQTAYDIEDACLLTAAINGDHTMQLSYKGIGGKFYKNYEANVKQGYYRAVLHRTSIKRTRKGQIFNASASDYSRLEMLGFNGWDKVLPPYPNGDCVQAQL